LNGLWKILWAAELWFCAYWLLKKTINHVREQSTNRLEGHLYALGFLASALVASIGIHQLLSQSGCLGLRARSALMVQIFKKSLVLARIKGGAGDIVNLVSNDCTKVADAFTNCHYLWSALVELVIIFALAFYELGISALPALGIVLIVIPIEIYIGLVKSRIGFKNTMTTSRRVHIMSEILTAIKLIKFYAWEQPFFDRICEIRKKELHLLKKDMILTATNFAIVITVPVTCALLTFLTYWKTGHVLNPVIGFTIISVFNTLRYPLVMAPLAVNSASGNSILLFCPF
jgi:ABC-type multidrug transport system fused ATPase/permease subunit